MDIQKNLLNEIFLLNTKTNVKEIIHKFFYLRSLKYNEIWVVNKHSDMRVSLDTRKTVLWVCELQRRRQACAPADSSIVSKTCYE